MRMLREVYKTGELLLDKIYKKNYMINPKLIDLFWECTLSCNANCKHCGSSCEKKLYKDELTTQEIKDSFKQIASSMDSSKILINVTGGEPLVRNDLFEVMEYANKELGFAWGMTTNGILLNESNIQKLKNANMETISISIDGLEETHNKFRGVKNSYKTIIKNIENLIEANFVKHIQVTTVFHKNNINELNELYLIMKNLKINSWRLATMDPIGRAKENDELLLDCKEQKYLLDFIKEKKKDKSFRINYGCPSFLGIEYEKEVRDHYFICTTGINVASILYNGDLFVCPNVPRQPNLIQGNIRTDNFKEVWENKYKEFRVSTRLSNDECNKCEHWHNCLGGAYHTWDFEKNQQNRCVYKMLNSEIKEE